MVGRRPSERPLCQRLQRHDLTGTDAQIVRPYRVTSGFFRHMLHVTAGSGTDALPLDTIGRPYKSLYITCGCWSRSLFV